MHQVLVTRPQPNNQRCVTRLQANGYTAIGAPMLDITTSEQLSQLPALLASLDKHSLLVAVSQYAIESCQSYLQQHQLSWPQTTHYLAVGQATAECWRQYGITPMVPQRQDSEGMLQLIQQQLSGIKTAYILRGQQGREWLAEQLQAQGIKVNYLSCYQRHLINYTQPQLEQWQSQINTIVATSGEILKHLTTLMSSAQQAAWLRKTTLLVPSQRLQNYAVSLGFEHIILCNGASDQACVEALAHTPPLARNQHDPE
ncbi:uroporphyrinogen-III synthase [Agarivorans gilvus]|uniref:Uroporphyrinogen-III synthase n=1 Tax=Agarivorans gilvus TaxID=680279 RepID=A0ABQ1I0I8_9ALTE|nr:uroporphyrinogen-III synthase [Agarivorans gilvus]GGB04251.1 uroporphyrinogen-III synthase [Agarivorans gilvus]